MLKNRSKLNLFLISKLSIFLSSMILFNERCAASKNEKYFTEVAEKLLHEFHEFASAGQFFPIESLKEKYLFRCNEKLHSSFTICTSSIEPENSIISGLTIITTISNNRTSGGWHERIVINIPASACLTYFDFTTMLPAGFTSERENYQSSLKIKSVQPASIHTNNTSTVFDYINHKPGSSYSIYIDASPSSKNQCVSTAVIQAYRESHY